MAKEILDDSEIHHPLNENLLQEAETIKLERKTLKDRLEKLEATKGTVSESVYQRVKNDYFAKLGATTQKLLTLKRDLESEEKKLREKKALVESRTKLHQERIEESNLRHALGEYDAEKHKEAAAKDNEQIERLTLAQKSLEEGLSRHQDIFQGEDLPIEPPVKEVAPPPPPKAAAVEKPAPAPAPTPVTAPPPAAAPAPERSVAENPPPATPSPAPQSSPSIRAFEPTPIATQMEPPPPRAQKTEHTAKIRVDATDSSIKAEAPSAPAPASSTAAALKKVSELHVFENSKVIQTVLLDHTVGIGRSPSNDVVLKEPKVSRRHAEIQFVGGKYIILDLESSNGTYVSGKRVSEQVLQPNDEIVIGNTRMVFKG